ncbi:uncharacterized protein [Primulina huaijiensis]|uniref:uncharacterized protein n=1 Tax=Primulina huaijiensis TaxID=1492673 RepID=UPI003CC794D5
MQAAKETAANVAASARAGMEKTKATVLEKAEQAKTRDPMMKDMATQKKEVKIQEAEREKQGAIQQNRAARHEVPAGGYGGFTAIGGANTGTGPHHHHPAAPGHTAGGPIHGGAAGAEYPAGVETGGAGHLGGGHLTGDPIHGGAAGADTGGAGHIGGGHLTGTGHTGHTL